MNVKLKKFAKLRKQLQLMHLNPGVPLQTTDYGKMLTKASIYRVTTYGPYVTDTKKFRIDTNSGLSWDEIKYRQMDLSMSENDFRLWLNAIGK